MEGEDDFSGGSTMIEEELCANGSGTSFNEEKRRAPAITGEQLDIEAYATLYSGRTKVARLLFIADRYASETNHNLQLEALRMAYDEIKKGENTQLFREVVEKIGGRLGSNYAMDISWCEAVDRRAEQKKEKLENELNAYRTNLIKESIRMGYNDFGDFYYAHGSLGDAFKNYVRTRDYCTTSKHIIHMCMSAILVSIEMGQFTHVTSYVNKAEQTPEALDPITSAKLRSAAGLAHLETKKYKLAARKKSYRIPIIGIRAMTLMTEKIPKILYHEGLDAIVLWQKRSPQFFPQEQLKQKLDEDFIVVVIMLKEYRGTPYGGESHTWTLEMPPFDGDNLDGWVFHIKQIFLTNMWFEAKKLYKIYKIMYLEHKVLIRQ